MVALRSQGNWRWEGPLGTPRGLVHWKKAEFLTLATGSDRILVELFQILKDDAVESAALNMQYAICTQYAI